MQVIWVASSKTILLQIDVPDGCSPFGPPTSLLPLKPSCPVTFPPPPTHPHTFLCKNTQEKFELKLPKIAGNWLKSVTV